MRRFSASSGKNPSSSKRLYWIESWCFLPLLKHLLISLLSQFNVVAGCLLSFHGDDRPEIARIQLRR
jgi:hypothetical protein